MYKIEYQQDNGLVTSITDATETPVTLQEEGVAYYNGEIPEDREGFTKELYWGVDPEVNANTKARIANSETLYAAYTPIEGWLELATMEYVNTELDKKTDKTYTDQKLGEKFDKNKILPTYPTVEPADDTTVLSAKQQYKKDNAQDAKIATKADQSDLVQLEQDVNLLNRKPQGLRFKSGDNTVFAKTMKALVLGTEDFTVCVVARSEGSNGDAFPFFGFSKATSSASSIKTYALTQNGVNGVRYIRFQDTNLENSIFVNKTDNTTNLHHIVITRSGTLVTCTINGRLVKSVTQDRVLDFSNFIYDIANTSYFWGGAVFNYAMTQAESNKLLWNGGRYDEVKLPSYYKNTYITDLRSGSGSNNFNVANITYSGNNSNVGKIHHCIIELTSNEAIKVSVAAVPYCDTYNYKVVDIPANTPTLVTISYKITSNTNTYQFNVAQREGTGAIIQFVARKIISPIALLEYRPENIRDDRYLNSGTMGGEYDLVYSTVKPEIIYDKPYADKIVLEDKAAPTDFPIAVGQRCYTNNGSIYEANLPTMGSEWAVSNWKQTNNG